MSREELEKLIMPTEGIDFFMKYGKNLPERKQKELIIGIKSGLTEEQLLHLCNPTLDTGQTKEVRLAFENGLSAERIYPYMLDEISCQVYECYQMREVRLALNSGLSDRQIRFFYRENFLAEQMQEARLGFTHSLCEDQVAFYYSPVYRFTQMEQARLAFEHGLSKEEVTEFYQENIHSVEMKQIRITIEHKKTSQQQQPKKKSIFAAMSLFG